VALAPLNLTIERGLARTFAGHIHWRACGSGPVVMLSHINQQSSALMIELLQALGRDFRAIAIDYPSHGHSDHIDWQPAIEDYARCVIEVMEALGIERAVAMGEAVGAATSIALGARWPQRIDKVVLINTPYFTNAETAKSDIADIAKVRPSDPSGFPAPRTIDFMLANDPEHAPMRPTQSWMDRINTAQLEIGRDRWQAMGALAKFDTLSGMAALTCPVLMLYGEHFIYGRHRALLQSKCPQAAVEIVPGARFCMSWERADDIAQLARAFLKPSPPAQRGEREGPARSAGG
jgi:pimeloyl-ACP methyl ester carboxylesterase